MSMILRLALIGIALVCTLSGSITGTGFSSARAQDTADQSAKVAATVAGTVVVEIQGVRNHNGQLLVGLWKEAASFPEGGTEWKGVQHTLQEGTQARVEFQAIPYGQYAISLIHDENQNGKLDTNFIGIPTEGIGASNDAKARFGPPKFDEAVFTLNGERHTFTISMQYF